MNLSLERDALHVCVCTSVLIICIEIIARDLGKVVLNVGTGNAKVKSVSSHGLTRALPRSTLSPLFCENKFCILHFTQHS